MAYEELAGRLLDMRMNKEKAKAKPKKGYVVEANPYAVRKSGNKFQVVKKSTGEVRGTHATKEKALRQFRLLEGVEHGWRPTRK